jgi:hypothetical protein
MASSLNGGLKKGFPAVETLFFVVVGFAESRLSGGSLFQPIATSQGKRSGGSSFFREILPAPEGTRARVEIFRKTRRA